MQRFQKGPTKMKLTRRIFARGQEIAAKQGLILVDTKYEFGKRDGKVYLIDEIHTPDSSRYFYADGYEEKFEKGEPQRQLSKEFVRADRYAYTAFARDVARGVDPNWVRNVYSFAIKPDLAIYFDINPKDSMARICANRAPKFYEAGMDLKLSNDPYESYMIFQGRVINEYQKMVDEFGLVKLDAMDSIHSKQVAIRRMLKEILSEKGVNL